MSKFKVTDQDSYEFVMPDPLSTDDIVDRDGYRSVSEQVEELLRAGRNLQAHRREEYDYEDIDTESDIVAPDPTRQPGYDLADASQDLEQLRRSIYGRTVDSAASGDTGSIGDSKLPQPTEDTRVAKEDATGDVAP